MKRQTLVYPYRKEGGATANVQPKIPACRAWRIVPILAADVAAFEAAVAGGHVARPQLAAGARLRDGAFPVWAQLTKPGRADGALLLVDHDGWCFEPTDVWTIRAVTVGASVGPFAGEGLEDRFAYVVEYIDTDDSLDRAGQVNPPNAPVLTEDVRTFTGSVPAGTYVFPRPRWARSGTLAYRFLGGGAPVGLDTANAFVLALWGSGHAEDVFDFPAVSVSAHPHTFASLGPTPKAVGAMFPAADVIGDVCPAGGLGLSLDVATAVPAGTAALVAHWSA